MKRYESFDLVGSIVGIGRRHTTAGAGLQIVVARTGNGLTGTLGASLADNTWRSWALVPPLSYKGLHGFAVIYSSLPGSNTALFSVLDSTGAAQITFAVTSTGAIAVYRGTVAGTLLGTSADGFVSTSAYRMLEFDFTIRSGASGAFEIHSTPSSGSGLSYALTGINTNPAAALSWTYTETYLIDGLPTIDDAYWNSGSGVTGGGFLGDVLIKSAVPTTVGVAGTWTPSTSTLPSVLDDIPPNLDTDYASALTPGTMDFTMDTITGSGTVDGVQISAVARSISSAELNTLRLTYRTTASLSGATQPTTTAYGAFVELLATDPATATAWTVAGINAGFFGIERVSV